MLLFFFAVVVVKALKSSQVGRLPVMGYNTWNDLRCSKFSATDILRLADKLDTLGLKDKGYRYFNVDDCWATHADGDDLVPDAEAFPDGMLSLSRALRAKGFKFGLYADRGFLTCAGRPGSRLKERAHAAQFAQWEVDYLKYDSCYSPNVRRSGALADYERMRDALNATGRDVVFAVCGWSAWYAPYGATLGHQWRISADADEWANIYVAVRTNERLSQFAGPSKGFNDPDMLVGSSGEAAVSLTPTQSRTQFSLWAVMAAPLLLGLSIETASPWDLETYSNRDVIAIDQDPLGLQGTPIRSTCPPYEPKDNWWCSPWSMPADVAETWQKGLANLVAPFFLAVALLSRFFFPKSRKRRLFRLSAFAMAIGALLYARLLIYYRPTVDECVQIWAKTLSPAKYANGELRHRAAVVFVNFESVERNLACDRGCIADLFPLSPDAPHRHHLADRGPFLAKELYAKREFRLSVGEPLLADLLPHGDSRIFILTEVSQDDPLTDVKQTPDLS